MANERATDDVVGWYFWNMGISWISETPLAQSTEARERTEYRSSISDQQSTASKDFMLWTARSKPASTTTH